MFNALRTLCFHFPNRKTQNKNNLEYGNFNKFAHLPNIVFPLSIRLAQKRANTHFIVEYIWLCSVYNYHSFSFMFYHVFPPRKIVVFHFTMKTFEHFPIKMASFIFGFLFFFAFWHGQPFCAETELWKNKKKMPKSPASITAVFSFYFFQFCWTNGKMLP